jgi:transcriptional regulator with XRE-family HTH domain
MSTEREKKSHSPLTGRRYNSVDEFLSGESVAPEVRSAVSKLDRETEVVNNLIQARRDAGLTQQQMAEKLGKTQSAISKLESSEDREVTLQEIMDYAKVAEVTFSMMVGQRPNHIAMVKHHALAMRKHLSALANEAHRNKEVEQAIKGIFGEAFFNLLTIWDECMDEMPNRSNRNIQFSISKVNRLSSIRHSQSEETTPA